MKYLLIVLVIITSCSKPDYTEIEKRLAEKRESAYKVFYLDSLRAMVELKENLEISNNYDRQYSQDSLLKIVEEQGAIYAREYNKPYKLSKDRNLNLQTYLDYCKNYNKDPMTYINFMED